MRTLVTAGPTRQYIDTVRFITNGSSGRMGFAVAEAAAAAGHEVILLAGPVCLDPPPGCRTVGFVTVDDLQAALGEHFPWCDALIMAAAVGDFRTEHVQGRKLHRLAGRVTLELVPTEDLLAGVSTGRRDDQRVVAFAVEDGDVAEIQAKARGEMRAKGADFVVVNTPQAMGADESHACILSRGAVVLEWRLRTKRQLADAIVRMLAADTGLSPGGGIP